MSDEIDVRIMEPTDAAGLSACIRRCYGISYPKRVMYEPVALAEWVRSRVYNGVVATVGADIIGHIGYNRPNLAATVVEAGTTVVDARYRGAGLMGRLASVLRANIIADNASGFVHYPTTAHTVMQKASLQSGGCETGVMLAYLPSEARDLTIGGSGEDRLAVTVVYEPLVEAPARKIFLPDRYHELISDFAKHLQLRRTFTSVLTASTGETKVRRITDMNGTLERFTVEHIGNDFTDVILAAKANSDASLIHVDLMMNQPEIDHAVEALLEAGFAYSAWLPGWNESDALRLQLPKNPTTSELHPTLYSSPANDIVALIRGELAEALH